MAKSIRSMVSTVSLMLNKGHERSIKARKNILFSFLVKGGSIGINLLLVPLTISYISASQYGVWLTLSSVIGWFSFFDIGLGNGLRNKLAESIALRDYKQARVYVSTTYAILGIIVAFILLAFLGVNHFVNWAAVLNVPARMQQELSLLALVVFSFFCLQFLLQLIVVILTANQEPAKASFMTFSGSLMALLIIFVLTKTTQGSLLNLAWALSASPVVVLLLSSLWLYNTYYKQFTPSIKYVDFKYARQLFSMGGTFFVIQIGAMMLFQTDNIVITQLFGPAQVTNFNVAYKLFFVFIMIFSVVVTPYWSSFTEAYTTNDMAWIRNTFNTLIKFWMYFILLVLIALAFSPLLFKLWLGGSVQIPFTLSVSIAAYVIGFNWLMIHCHLLNGIGKLRLQFYLYIFSMIVNIPMGIWLGKVIGVEGVVISNIILFIIMGVVFSIQCRKILNQTATGIWIK